MPITDPDSDNDLSGCWGAPFPGKDGGPVKTVLVAAAALIDADGRVLIAKRPEGKSMAGLWEFPGGKVDAGELPETALVRELDEELGIDITETCLAPFTFASHAYDDFHLLMPLYLCRIWKGSRSRAKAKNSNGCHLYVWETIPCRPPMCRWSRCFGIISNR